MNTKTAKKVGEAHAFLEALNNLYRNYENVMTDVFQGSPDEHIGAHSKLQQLLQDVSRENDQEDVMTEKSSKTVVKIEKMGETYVGDEWDNPVEVVEWLSFLLGAAVVHWQVIAGSAESSEQTTFIATTKSGLEHLKSMFSELEKKAKSIGKERAQD
jgi:ElaB/YqjD/DUF883 family membrane-anchored ribosome-binding protein